MAPVNTTSRAERARQTRRRMLDSARDLFIPQGYTSTTMGQIADRANVAVQTLHYTFKTKGRLLVEVVDVVAAGGDPVPVPQRGWYLEMMSSNDVQRILALIVEHGTAIYERVAVLWPVIDEALSDPFVADYWQGIHTGRRNAQRHQAARLSELGPLKPGLTVERAADLMFLLAGHPPYRALVEEAGWPLIDYRSWLFTTLVQQLLGTPVDPTVIADLSFVSPAPRNP